MGLLPDTQNCGLRMCRECRERFPRHWLQRKPLVSNPGIHHSTCVTQVPWCMTGLLTSGGGDNAPRIPGACATRNFAYLVRGPCVDEWMTYEWYVLSTVSMASLNDGGYIIYMLINKWYINDVCWWMSYALMSYLDELMLCDALMNDMRWIASCKANVCLYICSMTDNFSLYSFMWFLIILMYFWC